MKKRKKIIAICFGILSFCFFALFCFRLFAYNHSNITILNDFYVTSRPTYENEYETVLSGQIYNKSDMQFNNVTIYVTLAPHHGKKQVFKFDYNKIIEHESINVYHVFTSNTKYKQSIKVEFDATESSKFTLKANGFIFNPLSFIYLFCFGSCLTVFIFAVKPTKEQKILNRQKKLQKKEEKIRLKKLKEQQDNFYTQIEKSKTYKLQKVNTAQDLNNVSMLENMQEIQENKTIVCKYCGTINDNKNIKCKNCNSYLHK